MRKRYINIFCILQNILIRNYELAQYSENQINQLALIEDRMKSKDFDKGQANKSIG